MQKTTETKKRAPYALLFLWIAILVFSAANSVIAKLGLIGAKHLVEGRNPISFCNVLFAANFIAGWTLFVIYRKKWTREAFGKITHRDWINVGIFTILAAVIAPTLFFIGLMLTQVITVVLISTISIPLTLFFGWLIVKQRPSFGVVIASILALVGVLVTFFLHQSDPMSVSMKMTMANVGRGALGHFLATVPKAGEICIAISVIFTSFGVMFGGKVLDHVPTGIFSPITSLAGSLIFFFVAVIVFGWRHFIDLLDPFLWEWMLLYGVGIVGIGLYLWYRGIQGTPPSDFSIANSFTPIAGIFFAFLILGEVPELGQIIGGLIILCGIGVALYFQLRQKRKLIAGRKPQCFTGV
ncbi:MAG: hypothetical protein K1000chlam2_01451 [Chlamydiae bacterium]|nr:hypothetical protein [Chlamydiota bacterium]